MKDVILKMVRIKTEGVTIETLQELTATKISTELGISRNLASQYLNEFVNEGKLIKVNKKPVYFLAVEELELEYKKSIEKESYNIEEIQEYFTGISKEKKDFMKLIGYKGSLKDAVEQCKSSILYPPFGLPILFHGPTGTGKSYMANLMYEYAINTRKIMKDKKFVTVNCSEYANNPELLTANLFGAKKGAYTGSDKDTVGLIKVADGGILFLDEVHCLKPECQEKLFLFMDKGIYHMLGDNETWHEAKVRLVFATTENPEEVLLKTLLRRIAIITTIPSLEERPIEERKGLIYQVFKDESKNIKKRIRISNAVYKALLNGNLPGNVGQIKNCIKAGCANAFLDQIDEGEYLDIHIYNVPQFLLTSNNKKKVVVEKYLDNKMIDIEDINPEISMESRARIVELYEDVIKSYSDSKIKKILFEDFSKDYDSLLNRFYDYIMYSNIADNYPKIQYIQSILEKIFELTINQYSINIQNNDIIAFSRYLNDYIQNRSEISMWENKNKEIIKRFEEEIKVKLKREYNIAIETSKLLQNSLDVNLEGIALPLLAMNIKSYNKSVDINRIPGIILSHGYSTASSIADTANKLLDCYIFDAIDMPLGVSSDDIVKKIKDYINSNANFNEIILLVDMGSLEDIYIGIENDTNINIGIINNINTKLALDIGLKIIQGHEVEDILKESCNRNYSTYKYIKNRKLEKVILTICPTGIGTSRKVAELINKSLPRKIEINIMPQDYGLIVDDKTFKEFKEKYDIKLIIGTINPNIQEIPFISLENIISNHQLNYLEEIFSEYLTYEEIKVFKDNVVSFFSLSNIVDYLTILNPEKVLEVVSSSVKKMENKLNIELSASIKIGLYVHLSCLLERLITKNHITSYDCIEEFKHEEKDFIEIVRSALTEVEKYFSIEIPVEEIGYIFDYIKNNK